MFKHKKKRGKRMDIYNVFGLEIALNGPLQTSAIRCGHRDGDD